jgi:phosphonate ABC transporter permease subunit PhnE
MTPGSRRSTATKQSALADSTKKRRRLYLVLGVVGVVVIYGLAVERTGVSLDQITSESRQKSLVRIIRSLARPELVTYDFEETTTDVEYYLPCPGAASAVVGAQMTVTPGCGDPGQEITIVGTGFEPFDESGRLQFIPDSEFDVTLSLGRFTTDENGEFEVSVTLPDRPSEAPQVIRAVVSTRLGTWANRVQVWTDTNENGVLDSGVVEEGVLNVTVEGARTEVPAVALLDPTNQVTEFVTTGDTITAVDGPASGIPADPLAANDEDIAVVAIEAGSTATAVTVRGSDGTDLSAWRVAVYEGTTGAVVATAFLGDQVEPSPRVSQTTILTIEKIIDTVFLAFVATTAGLAIALPLSFLSARNLMKDVSTTVIGLSLGLLAIQIGVLAGSQYVETQRRVVGEAGGETMFLVLMLVAGGAAVWGLARLLFGRDRRSPLIRSALMLGAVVASAAFLEGLYGVLVVGGEALRDPFGVLGFVPGLFVTIGEVGAVTLPFVIGLGGIAVAVSLANKAAYWLNTHLGSALRHLTGYLALALAGASIGLLLGAVVDWLYQLANPTVTVGLPALVGASWGLWMADRGRRRGEVRIGLTIYYITRTIFNTLRSIEPLVMVIVFVVWVGFGEFAGSLALALHTAAALAKLYSEQVESIATGPLEAVRATGATRLQTTVYAVVPQIVPPYISFTMYRWDINVRMSTILGFAGGGGIGFLLNQNIQLGEYQSAAVQMLAIAIVVASMDYASSRLRERFT